MSVPHGIVVSGELLDSVHGKWLAFQHEASTREKGVNETVPQQLHTITVLGFNWSHRPDMI